MTDRHGVWRAICDEYFIEDHDFRAEPFYISADDIKKVSGRFAATHQREVRLLCRQDERSDRPLVFQKNRLFILPVKNGQYAIVQGEGYVDLPPIQSPSQVHLSQLDFPLVTSSIDPSDVQHLDFAYATSVIRTFMNDPSLVLTIRGRKYTPEFTFRVDQQVITVQSVQTEVDAGYEGQAQVVLVEAKRSTATNTIIRQLYYPFRQWQCHLKERRVEKPVYTVFFEQTGTEYRLWHFRFNQEDDYNSIELVRSQKFEISVR